MDNGARELRLFEHEGGSPIQVEINLEEAPLFMLQKSEQGGEDVIGSRSIVVTREGHRMEQYWWVTAHRDFGLPGAVDEHVFIAVMQLVQRRGGMPPDGRITFTLYELLEIVGKTHGGKNYEELRDSLDRIASTNVYAENAFYSMAEEDFKSHRFYLWDVTFRKKKRKGRASEHHTLKFGDILASSFAAGYLKSLDADFYNSSIYNFLKRDLARSLYRLVDAKRKKRPASTHRCESRPRRSRAVPNSSLIPFWLGTLALWTRASSTGPSVSTGKWRFLPPTFLASSKPPAPTLGRASRPSFPGRPTRRGSGATPTPPSART